MSKKYDIAAKVGTYQDKTGQTKARYQTVGAVIEGQNGPYILLEAWFNPAALERQDGKSNVILSLFEPRQNQDQPF